MGSSTPSATHGALPALLGIALAVITVAFFPTTAEAPTAAWMAGVAVLMGVWWVFEVVPIPVTSLLPLILLPALDIAKTSAVAANYGKPTIFLFLGGFLLAIGLQRTRLHRRLALLILRRVGTRPSRLVLGFMLASASLSMWISNTASVMVMLPIALSVLEEARKNEDKADVAAMLGTAIMLGIAYSADIGGMATLVGTPPNLAFLEIQTQIFPAGPRVGFAEWMAMGLPLSVVFLASGWFLLTRVIFRLPRQPLLPDASILVEQSKALGQLRRDELASGVVFAVTALLWITGADLTLGDTTIPGWRSLTGLTQASDAVVAVAGATALFLIPSKDRPGERILEWEDAGAVPWGLLLLFGGGFALADGFKISGLSGAIGSWLSAAEGLPVVVIVILVCVVLTFLTELTSNTATTTLVLPILASAGVALGIDPRVLMIPATLSASCAFMMPVASPTQAIVFGSGYVTIKQMVRAGIWFNILGIVVVCVMFFLIGVPVLGIDLDTLPAWAAKL